MKQTCICLLLTPKVEFLLSCGFEKILVLSWVKVYTGLHIIKFIDDKPNMVGCMLCLTFKTSIKYLYI